MHYWWRERVATWLVEHPAQDKGRSGTLKARLPPGLSPSGRDEAR